MIPHKLPLVPKGFPAEEHLAVQEMVEDDEDEEKEAYEEQDEREEYFSPKDMRERASGKVTKKLSECKSNYS